MRPRSRNLRNRCGPQFSIAEVRFATPQPTDCLRGPINGRRSPSNDAKEAGERGSLAHDAWGWAWMHVSYDSYNRLD